MLTNLLLVFKPKNETYTDSRTETRKLGYKKEKVGKKKKHSGYSSSDDEGLERVRNGSRKKKKWYVSNDDMSSNSEESGSQSESERDRKKHRSWKKEKKMPSDCSNIENKSRPKKKSRSRIKGYSSVSESESRSESEKSSEEENHHKGGMRKKDQKRGTNSDNVENDLIGMVYLTSYSHIILSNILFYTYLSLLGLVKSDDSRGSQSRNSMNIVRKELGLEWMLRPKDNKENSSSKAALIEPEEASAEEVYFHSLPPLFFIAFCISLFLSLCLCVYVCVCVRSLWLLVSWCVTKITYVRLNAIFAILLC